MRVSRWAGLVVTLVAFVSVAAEPEAPKLTKEEQQIIDLTNKARAKEKLSPLKLNALVYKAARNHSTNMAKQQKMEHELDGKRVDKRMDDVGYDFELNGENIGELSDLKDVPKLFEAWMGSKSHRANIMEPKFEEIGVAIVQDAKKKRWYITQVFGTPAK
jgi:uncharacterized protein YkwD